MFSPNPSPYGYSGFEVDALDLGDADCVVLTQWQNGVAHRILIDAGRASDATKVRDFLIARGYREFWAVVCTHLHKDHAGGLINIVHDPAFTFSNGWMHNINRHLSADALRRAARLSDVQEVTELTTRLIAAFARRGITPKEPFAGMTIAGYPGLHVLGPSLAYYREVINEFTEVEVFPTFATALAVPHAPSLGASLAGLGGIAAPLPYRQMLIPPPGLSTPFSRLAGALANSSVKRNPTTQPYNNTSAILGVVFNGTERAVFAGDAGSQALSQVDWTWHGLTLLGVPHHGSDGNLSQRDIERFCPKFALISATGDSSHPSRAMSRWERL